MRVDLPGLISEGLRLWVNEERDIAFEGKMKSEPEYEYEYERGSFQSSQKCYPLESPFLVRGRVAPYLTKEREDWYLAKFDLPGLSKEDLRVWVKSNILHFKGEEHRNGDEVESDDDDDEGDDDGFKGLRIYLGAIELPPEERFSVDQIRAELKNGVLKVVVPKLKLQDRNDVFLVNVD
ncbi:24.1 kDa heat shock protein, mitochondrial-like [Cornus florida]|uniref:24.1 kDa heat shock protein, mitochondrial-like n=1 Tax=Cornus florida TaxID=4283 RepID=UPI00289DF889|nr:24.1 kDa heat shock protein, mitochondrial-like [Cornus florida]